MIFHIFSYYTTLLYQKKNLKTNNVIGSIFLGKSFGNVFVWSKCVNARILLIWSFDEIYYYYGVSDKMSIVIMELVIK